MTVVLEAQEPSARYVVQRESALIRGFELLTTAPGGVTELRSFIRSLAVRGLLVPQDTSDEPASSLRRRNSRGPGLIAIMSFGH